MGRHIRPHWAGWESSESQSCNSPRRVRLYWGHPIVVGHRIHWVDGQIFPHHTIVFQVYHYVDLIGHPRYYPLPPHHPTFFLPSSNKSTSNKTWHKYKFYSYFIYKSFYCPLHDSCYKSSGFFTYSLTNSFAVSRFSFLTSFRSLKKTRVRWIFCSVCTPRILS